MSLFDSASLVVTPSGYKEDKLYSIKPTDGSGDLVVTRATTATRVNSDGLIEVVPYNLLLNSLAFAANYSYNQCSITSSQVAPDGTNNAKRITNGSTATDSYFEQSISFTPNTYTWSIFVKQGTAATATIKPVHVGLGADVSLMTFTFATETITSSGSISSTGFEKLANGWYRIFCSVVIPSSVSSLRGRFGNPNVANVYNDWAFPQLVTGNSAKEYFPTTDRLDIPRLDYTNSSCPSILVEPQRTNVAKYSEDFTNAEWTTNGFGVTTSANTTIAPDGNSTADSILTTATTGVHYVQQRLLSATAGVTYTMSVYVKKLGYDYCRIQTSNTATAYGEFRFSTKTLTISGANVVANSGKVTEMANGWFRIEMSILAPASAGWRWWIECLNDSAQSSFTGDVTKGLYVWGFQFEVGSNATSYVPTIASSVTRNADVISKTGISSLIGQTEGTLFVDVNYEAESITKNYFNLGTSTSNYIAIIARSNNKIGIEVLNSGVQVNASSTSTYSTNQRLKIAMTYKENDFKLYVNGILQATDTSGTVPAKAEVYLGSYGNATNQATDGINSAILWKTALTDQECINLTTL